MARNRRQTPLASGRSRERKFGLAEDLCDRGFAREFLVAAADDGVPVQLALKKVILSVIM
ncbi:MAG: hypothetical protein M3401_09510 [Actinomycetota bacterium]|nr:hypothetical protein [Actinomycetota bacterium]